MLIISVNKSCGLTQKAAQNTRTMVTKRVTAQDILMIIPVTLEGSYIFLACLIGLTMKKVLESTEINVNNCTC